MLREDWRNTGQKAIAVRRAEPRKETQVTYLLLLHVLWLFPSAEKFCQRRLSGRKPHIAKKKSFVVWMSWASKRLVVIVGYLRLVVHVEIVEIEHEIRKVDPFIFNVAGQLSDLSDQQSLLHHSGQIIAVPGLKEKGVSFVVRQTVTASEGHSPTVFLPKWIPTQKRFKHVRNATMIAAIKITM